MHFSSRINKKMRVNDTTTTTPRNLRIPVPVQPSCVMTVEEVRFGAQGANVRVEPQELQQSPGAPLFNPYDESLGQPPSGRPFLARAVRLQPRVSAVCAFANRGCAGGCGGGGDLLGLAAPVPLVRPSGARHQELARGRLDLGVVRQLRLAASGQEIDQGEAEDAQRGGDGEPVEEPAEVRARVVEVEMVVVVVVVLLVKGCHPSEIRVR